MMPTTSKRNIFLRAAAIMSIAIFAAGATIWLISMLPQRSDQYIFPQTGNVVSVSDIASGTDITPEAEHTESTAKAGTATLMFGGDVLIHKPVYLRASAGEDTYNFNPYFELFTDVFTADYNAVNLESPVDAYGNNQKISTYPKFNAPIELLDAIKSINVDLCTNSNNHIIDQGFDGLVSTINNLDAHGLDHLGTYASQEEHDALFIREINGIKVGFAAFTQSTNGIKLSSELEEYAFDRMGMKEDAVDDILPRVEALRSAGAEIVVAVLHWGTEYNEQPSFWQRVIAEDLCEGGVDIIIGSHSHIVQPIERMTVTNDDGTTRECLVVYSLGNLFCNQERMSEYTQRGMVVAIKLERGDDGIARFTDAFYMPTLLQVTWEMGTDFLRLVPAAKYMEQGSSVPELLARDLGFQTRCADTWEYVTKIVGNDIPAVTDPAHYPEGFFSGEAE